MAKINVIHMYMYGSKCKIPSSIKRYQ